MRNHLAETRKSLHMTQEDLGRYIDATTDVGAYVLGILWGICSPMGGEGYWLRHRDPW